MVQCGYNLQEVLAPLMQRFGRHMHCGRAEGFGRMVSEVSEALRVNRTTARRLVQQLASAGLIDFKTDTLGVEAEERSEQFVTAGTPAPGRPASPATGMGVWRIGPCV